MAMLEPKLAILDETDSGLDIDASLRINRMARNKLQEQRQRRDRWLHYQRLLEILKPGLCAMYKGRIVKSARKNPALELEWIRLAEDGSNPCLIL